MNVDVYIKPRPDVEYLTNNKKLRSAAVVGE